MFNYLPNNPINTVPEYWPSLVGAKINMVSGRVSPRYDIQLSVCFSDERNCSPSTGTSSDYLKIRPIVFQQAYLSGCQIPGGQSCGSVFLYCFCTQPIYIESRGRRISIRKLNKIPRPFS